MEQVNLIPFYACAIAFARHIRLDLESEYGKNAVAYCDTPTRVLANGRGFLRHGRTPQRTITSPLHPVTGLPLSRLFCGCLF